MAARTWSFIFTLVPFPAHLPAEYHNCYFLTSGYAPRLSRDTAAAPGVHYLALFPPPALAGFWRWCGPAGLLPRARLLGLPWGREQKKPSFGKPGGQLFFYMQGRLSTAFLFRRAREGPAVVQAKKNCHSSSSPKRAGTSASARTLLPPVFSAFASMFCTFSATVFFKSRLKSISRSLKKRVGSWSKRAPMP